MKVSGNKKILEHGDIIVINGKTYYCDKNAHCYECALSGRKTCLNSNYIEYDCTYKHVSILTANEVIKREEDNIKECQQSINEFIKDKEEEIKNSKILISKLRK